MEFRQHYLENARFEFQRMKGLAERAMEQIPSADGFHFELDEASNSIAVLIQHLSGNMVSRWTDFLTSDGEKPTRHRDAEFGSNPERTRDELLTIWGRGWSSLFESLGARSYPATNRPCFVSHRPTRLRCPACQRRRMAELEHPERPIGKRDRTLQEAL